MKEENNSPAAIQPIVDLGSALAKNERGNLYCLTIIGQIEGHMLLSEQTKTTRYEHVLPLLAALEQNREVDGILLLLNTVGGDVEAGLAMAELIAGMRKPTVSLVLGGGHSIGIPLAVAPRASFIAPSASMLVHPVRAGGNIVAAPQTWHYYERLQERIIRFVAEHSSVSREKLRALMLCTDQLATDVGTLLDGEQAAALGLVDAVGDLHDALERLYALIGEERADKSGEMRKRN